MCKGCRLPTNSTSSGGADGRSWIISLSIIEPATGNFLSTSTINLNNSLAKGFTTNTLIYEGKETVVGSSQHNSYPTATGVVKAGLNYAKGPNRLAHITAIILNAVILKTQATNGLTITPKSALI